MDDDSFAVSVTFDVAVAMFTLRTLSYRVKFAAVLAARVGWLLIL